MKHAQTLPPTDPNGKPAARDSKSKNSRPIMETNTLGELNFEKFLFSDMSKFSAEIKRTETKMFSPKEYLVEMTISNIPTFIVPKTLAEFKAFYKALKLRFANIQWPEFPGTFRIFNRKVQKKQILNKILQNICEVAKLRDKDKKALLGIFYAFFLDPQIVNKVRKNSTPVQPAIDPKKSTASTTSTIVTEADADAEADNPDIVNAFQKDIEDRYQNLYKGSPEESSPFKDDLKEHDSSPMGMSRDSPNLNPLKGHPALSHSASVPGEFVLSEAQYDHSQLEHNRSNMRSFAESIPSPFLGPSHSVLVSQPDQDIDKTYTLDRSDEIHDSEHLNLSAENDMRRSQPLVKGIIKRGKGDSVHSANAPETRATSFLDTIGRNESMDINDKVVAVEKIDPKEKKKEEKKKKKEKEKEDKRKHIEEAAMSRRRARGTSGVKEIPNFAGIIYMRLSSEKKWSKYFARLSNNCLVLYRSILESSPVHFIPCFRCELRYIHSRSGDYMEFWHTNDEDRFQITLVNDDEDEIEDIDSSDLSKDLSMWYEQIRIVSEKIAGLELTGNKYSPIGKLQVVIYGAFDVKGLPNNSSCYIRISHTPYVLATSKTLRSDIMKWKQSFFVPLCDTFFPISIELVCVYNDGWITEKHKEEVICTSEILIADVISLKSTNILTINLPMKYTDAKLKALAKQYNVLEKDMPQPKIEVRLKNLSSLKSYFAPPYADYIEGVKFDSDTFSKQLMKLSISRLKRIITYIAIKMTELELIFHFKYPLFSYICLLLFTYFIIRFDVSSLAQDLILFIVMFCTYKNPKVEKTVLGVLDRIFFQPQHLNPFYTQPRILTTRDMDIKKLMNTEKWKYKLVDPDSLVTVFKKARKSIIAVTITLTKITGFVEKFKNIIIWKDSTRTTVFIVFSLLAYCFISVMGFRLIVLFGIWANFAKGLKYYELLNQRNQETARLALQFILKEHFPDQYNTIFNDLNVPWPTANFNVFQAKIIEKMKARLSIILPEDVLRIARTPVDFILMLATSSAILKLKMSPAEENSVLLLKKRTPKFGLKNIIYFIMNVPSDYYRVVHPKIVDITECKQE